MGKIVLPLTILKVIAPQPYQARKAVTIPAHPPILIRILEGAKHPMTNSNNVKLTPERIINRRYEITHAIALTIKQKRSQENR